MRQFWSILLILFFSGPFIGGHLLLPIIQKTHQKKIQVELARGAFDDTLVKFVFTQAEFHALEWEHSHEFQLDGKMYDVRSIEKKGEMILVWCWEDTLETSLRELSKEIKDQNQTKIPLNQKKSLLQPRIYHVNLYLPEQVMKRDIWVAYQPYDSFQVQSLLSIIPQQPLTPPPKLIVQM